MVRLRGEDIKYCEGHGGWFLWDGSRWARDELRAIENVAKEVVEDLFRDAVGLEDEDRRRAMRHAMSSESAARINAMIALARSESPVAMYAEEFDASPNLLNVENGVVDLRTGKLLSHDRRYLMTKVAPVEFDPDAGAPLFKEFLNDIVTPEVANYIQRLVGLSLLGEVKEHLLVFLHGLGANGKTSLLLTLQAALGDYAKQAEPELLLARKGQVHPTGVADLAGARLVATTEVADGRSLAEALVKQLTGGDRVKARYMHRDFFEFCPSWTIWLAANHKPTVKGQDDGIWRRIKVVPFEVAIPPEDQDPDLVKKLKRELPGILAWAVQGCLDYQRDGLREPIAVKTATNSYRAESDSFGTFLEEETQMVPEAWSYAGDLYSAYKGWCERAGERAKSQREVGILLRQRGFEKANHPNRKDRKVIYKGLSLPMRRGEGERNLLSIHSQTSPLIGIIEETLSHPFSGTR